MNKIVFTPEEGREIIDSNSEDFDIVLQEITDTSRWSIHYYIVVKRKSDGKFFASNYRVGATECQDERPFEYDDEAVFIEVAPVEEIKIVYKVV